MNRYVTGTTIKQLREARQMTQAELAQKQKTPPLTIRPAAVNR